MPAPRCTAGEAVGLRQIELPEQIVRDERRPRADDQRERPAGARGQAARRTARARPTSGIRAKAGSSASVGSVVRRSTSAHGSAWRRMSTVSTSPPSRVNAERRPAAARSHATVDAPSTAMTLTPSRAPSLRERLVAHVDGALAERVRRLRVVAHRRSCSRSSVREALQENSLAPERLARRGLVVLAEARARHEVQREPPEALGLVVEPVPLETADHDPVHVDPDGAAPVVARVEVGARLSRPSSPPGCGAEAGGLHQVLLDHPPGAPGIGNACIERKQIGDRLR